MKKAIDWLAAPRRIRELEAEVRRLHQVEAEVRRLSIDPVTELMGRATLGPILYSSFARTRRYGGRLGVMMIDLDRFKNVNDTFGHRIGDEVLRDVSRLITGNIRGSDLAFRYGGDELLVLVEKTTARGVLEIARTIKDNIEGYHHWAAGVKVQNGKFVRVRGWPVVTVSIGVDLSRTADESPWDAVTRADEALFRAKRRGRNCVEGPMEWLSRRVEDRHE